jgi:hypothetical protein
VKLTTEDLQTAYNFAGPRAASMLRDHISALEGELLDAAELHQADESTIYQLEHRIVPGLRSELAEARKDSDLLRDLIDADDSGGDLLAERVWDEPYGKSEDVQAEVKAMLRSAIDKARF